MKTRRRTEVLLLAHTIFGYIIWFTATSPVITSVTTKPSNSLKSYEVFENSSVVTLICEIVPYTNVMKWKIHSALAADCISTFCNTYISGRFSYELDPANGVFNLTIDPVTFDDNGKLFECWDGTNTTQVRATVKETEKPNTSPLGTLEWCNDIGEHVCVYAIIGVISFIWIIQIAFAGPLLWQTINKKWEGENSSDINAKAEGFNDETGDEPNKECDKFCDGSNIKGENSSDINAKTESLNDVIREEPNKECDNSCEDCNIKGENSSDINAEAEDFNYETGDEPNKECDKFCDGSNIKGENSSDINTKTEFWNDVASEEPNKECGNIREDNSIIEKPNTSPLGTLGWCNDIGEQVCVYAIICVISSFWIIQIAYAGPLLWQTINKKWEGENSSDINAKAEGFNDETGDEPNKECDKFCDGSNIKAINAKTECLNDVIGEEPNKECDNSCQDSNIKGENSSDINSKAEGFNNETDDEPNKECDKFCDGSNIKGENSSDINAIAECFNDETGDEPNKECDKFCDGSNIKAGNGKTVQTAYDYDIVLISFGLVPIIGVFILPYICVKLKKTGNKVSLFHIC